MVLKKYTISANITAEYEKMSMKSNQISKRPSIDDQEVGIFSQYKSKEEDLDQAILSIKTQDISIYDKAKIFDQMMYQVQQNKI